MELTIWNILLSAALAGVGYVLKDKSDELKRIDILLNNAGTAFKGQIFDTSVFDSTFSVNFYGTVSLTEKFLGNNLIKENGKIIFIGSMMGNMKKLGDDLLKEFQKLFLRFYQLDQPLDSNFLSFEANGYE